jgi:predicted lipid-binding transport protein (Tim44 family)
MKRTVAVIALSIMVLVPLLWTVEAWARVGGGSSGGSRGSRSYSAPAKPSSPSPVAPSTPVSPAPAAPQRSGWGGMLGGALGGLLLGGLLGGLLFGGLGHGLFGGIGLLELAIIGALVYFGFRMMRSRQPQMAGPPGYATAGGYGGDDRQSAYSASATAMEAPPAATVDLDRGIGHIRQMDSGFDPGRFVETASDIFFKMQAGWMARDMSRAADVLTPEMQAVLQKDCDRMRAERRINRLENVAVRTAQVTEAWQERGEDYVTVCFLASLLDYTTDEQGRLVDGSQTEPVKFEEYWTFTRPVGPNPWRLSAIQQPA